METKTEIKVGPTRRKSTTKCEKLCAKEERNASFKKVSLILQKSEEERTLEEEQILNDYSEIVADIKSRWQKRDELKKRAEEWEEPLEILQEKALSLAQAILKSEHLVIYTGAGISTAAKIPDYRGSNGIWTRLQQGKDIENHDLSLAEPTYTHMALSELYSKKILKYIVSQNCDGLHLRSGLPRTAISELHGNMYIEVCKTCKPAREYWRLFDVTENTARYSHKTMRRCYICSQELVDTIVHFGERGTLQWPLNWKGACKNADDADTIICLGSSLKVLKRYPWLWQMNKPAKKRPNLYIVNLQWTPKDESATLKINGKCDVVMNLIMKYLGIKVPIYDREKDPIFAHATILSEEEMHTTTQPFLKDLQKEILENNSSVKEEKDSILKNKDEITTNVTKENEIKDKNLNISEKHDEIENIKGKKLSTSLKIDDLMTNKNKIIPNTIEVNKLTENEQAKNKNEIIKNETDLIENAKSTENIGANDKNKSVNTKNLKNIILETCKTTENLQNFNLETKNHNLNEINQIRLDENFLDKNINMETDISKIKLSENSNQNFNLESKGDVKILLSEKSLSEINQTRFKENFLDKSFNMNLSKINCLTENLKNSNQNINLETKSVENLRSENIPQNFSENKICFDENVKIEIDTCNIDNSSENIENLRTKNENVSLRSEKIYQNFNEVRYDKKFLDQNVKIESNINCLSNNIENSNQIDLKTKNESVKNLRSENLDQQIFKINKKEHFNSNFLDKNVKMDSKNNSERVNSNHNFESKFKILKNLCSESDYQKFCEINNQKQLQENLYTNIKTNETKETKMKSESAAQNLSSVKIHQNFCEINKIERFEENFKAETISKVINPNFNNIKLIENQNNTLDLSSKKIKNFSIENGSINNYDRNFSSNLDVTSKNLTYQTEAIDYSKTNNSNTICDKNTHSSIKVSRLTLNGTRNCTLSSNLAAAKRKPTKPTNMFSIDSILNNTHTPQQNIPENIQALMAYYEFANKLLQNQMLGYNFYPLQTSFMYPGLHSIINPTPYINYEFNSFKNIQQTSTKIEIKEEVKEEVPKEPSCEFCFNRFQSYTCLYYFSVEPKFVKELFRFSKTKNCKTLLVCICCDYTTEEEESSDEEIKNKKKVKKLDETDSIKEIENKDSLGENVDLDDKKSVKIQAGWFGKGYRKNRRTKKR